MDWLLDIFRDVEVHKKVISGVVLFLLTTVASFVIGRYYGKYKAWREWDRKHFLGRVIVSLNTFKEHGIGQMMLKIRTVFERSLEDVFTTPLAAAKVLAAAGKTTPENPVLPLAEEDRWFILNFILNAVAEEFNEGLVRYDVGEEVRPVKYLLCLTCEAVGDDRIRKVRAMMIRRDVLVDLHKYLAVHMHYEQTWHSTRLETLKFLRKLYITDPQNFLVMEVYV